jgi:ketosteroid isomerase-like protein
MNNKKVVETFMEGYNTGDNTKILSCLTEDVIWEMAGSFNLKGKDQFDKEIKNGLGDGNPTITISQLVEEGNIVVAEGTVKCKLKNGGFIDALFCEVFHFDNGKVKKLTTYHIEKKKA